MMYLAYLGYEMRLLDTAKADGREEGRVLTAKAALKKGLAVELIAEITGIPQEAILKLQSEMQAWNKTREPSPVSLKRTVPRVSSPVSLRVSLSLRVSNRVGIAPCFIFAHNTHTVCPIVLSSWNIAIFTRIPP
ncbi:MAG: hypothetical protein ACYCVD_00245 [Desulfitobacteriaceae bacterium]